MSFKCDELQLKILSSLEVLECHGCNIPTIEGVPTEREIVFNFGVPEVVLQGFVFEFGDPFKKAMLPLLRRGFVKLSVLKSWPFFGDKVQLLTPDNRVFHLRWAGEPVPFEKKSVRMSKRRSKKKNGPPPLGMEALVGTQQGTKLRNVKGSTRWRMSSWGKAYSITESGLAFLDSSNGRESPAELVTLLQVAPYAGCSKRTLERYVSKKKLPPPDVIGGDGLANKWAWSKLRESLSKLGYRLLPKRFPGSGID